MADTKVFEVGGITWNHSNFFTLTPKKPPNLIVTSPPYNLGIEYDNYDDAEKSHEEYLEFSGRYLTRLRDISAPQARLCVNLPFSCHINEIERPIEAPILLKALECGWRYKTTLVWAKTNVNKVTAWGSFQSANAPHPLHNYEVIHILYKDKWGRTGGTSTITKRQFMSYVIGAWTLQPETRRLGHPAMFPISLPLRCIKLFSYKEDFVFDPFGGLATTLIAAMLTERDGQSCDNSEIYYNLGVDRIKHYQDGGKQLELFSESDIIPDEAEPKATTDRMKKEIANDRKTQGSNGGNNLFD